MKPRHRSRPIRARHRARPRPSRRKPNGQFRSGTAHPKYVSLDALLRELRSMDLGTWKVVGAEVVYDDKGYRRVLCECQATGKTNLISVDSLRAGKSRGPRGVNNITSPNSHILGERYDAMNQRCNNPKDPNYKNYGGRGIKLLFTSRRNFILWAEETFPDIDFRKVEFDRINNNGHYEPGNLRLVTTRINQRNKRTNRYIEYKGIQITVSDAWHLIKTDYPNFGYSPGWTTKLLTKGEDINKVIEIGLGRKSKKEWHPDPDVISLYI